MASLIKKEIKMGMVFREVGIKASVGKAEVKALFDTGAGRTIIRKDIAEKVGSLTELTKPRLVTLGDGEHKIEVREGVFLEITFNDYFITTDADVSGKLAHDLIIGASTMQQWGIVINLKEGKVMVKEPKTSFELV